LRAISEPEDGRSMPVERAYYRRGTLRWLVVLIVLLAIAPMFALHLVRLQSSREALLQQAYRQAATLAESGVRAHQQIADHARQLLEVLAQVPSVRRASMLECEQVLKGVREGRDWLTGIYVFNAAGRGLCGTSSVARSLDVSDRPYFQEAVAGRFTVSDIIVSRASGNPIVAAALPLPRTAHNAEEPAVVSLGVSLPWIGQVAAEANSKFGGVLVVIDGAGNVVTYQPHIPAGWTRELLKDHPLVARITSAEATTFEAKDPAGAERLFSVARMPHSGIIIAVGLNRNDVLNPIEWTFRNDLLFLLVVALISIGLALLAAEFGLLRGVRALKRAALRLKAGKMGLRVRLPGLVAAELHDLAATYNAMTAEFERLAYLDRLTGLPNRRYLERHLSRRDETGARSLPGRQAVFAIDIDGFKPVNDGYGHAVGDRVLAMIARRIAGVVDERGHFFRVGGDEFVVIAPLKPTQGREAAREFAEEIRCAMDQAIEFDGLAFPIACSIGVALVPDDAKTLAGALEVADAALYEAKRGGRNRVMDMATTLVPDTADPVDAASESVKMRA
jgi:diguanylate cyclase (GGDEF)-like protein